MIEPANTPQIGSELRDQSLPFMFETDDDTYVLPINPESYDKEIAPRSKITLTQSGGYEDRTGWVLPKINIKGTFGYLGTYPGGNGKTLSSGVQMCGWDLYKELEDIFLSFYEQFGTNDDTGSLLMEDGDEAAKLRFYNFTDEDFYEVQISKFVVRRNIQHRLLYKYDIQLTALRRLDGEDLRQVDWLATQFDDLMELPSEAELSFWGQMLEGYKWVSEGMTDVINDIGEMQRTLSTIRSGVSSFRQGLSDLIAAPFELIQESINTVDSVLATITSVADLPHELVNHMRETKFALLSYKSKKDLFSESGTEPSTISETDTWEILTAPLPSGQITTEAGAVTMYDPEATLFDSSLENVTEVAALETAINKNDTLETLAARMLGDSSGWKRIALLNNLEYPYILNSDDPLDYMSPVLQTGSPSSAITKGDTTISLTGINAQPGDLLLIVEGSISEVVEVQEMVATLAYLGSPVENDFTTAAVVTRHEERLAILKPGDKIKIPGLKSNKVAIAGEGENKAFYDRLYGVDEALDAEGNLMSTTTGEPVDIGGMDNLQMQLKHRIITQIRELAATGHPTYGSAHNDLIGKGNMAVWIERAKLEGKIALLRDPRVRKVEKTLFVTEGTAIFLDADVVPINKEAGEKMRISVN
ncbi:hypothetical protein KAR91_37290 [Candidatus Pacearchaeota archaeon]|nr:hypothetical protein [Candidatus Pacearchaeota archaeon]